MRSIRPRTRSLFPSFKERSWGDSSFHSVAIRGQAFASASLLAKKSASARALLHPELHQSGTVRLETVQRSTIAFRNLCAARAIRLHISYAVFCLKKKKGAAVLPSAGRLERGGHAERSDGGDPFRRREDVVACGG